jgi:heat shock protein HslJ
VRSHRRTIATPLAAACLVALIALAAACGSTPGSSETSPASSSALVGPVWKATEVAGTAVPSGDAATEITAVFADGQVSGSGGVNRYNAGYETQSPDGISIGTIASTQMAGPSAAMKQEAAFFAALAKVSSYAVTADSLTLADDQGTTLARFDSVQPTALQDTEWHALAYNNGKDALVGITAAGDITAVFAANGTLSGNASVNRYSTTYTTSGASMTIDAAIATTKMAGDDKLMKQEAAYLAALPTTATYTIEGDELWLRDASGAAVAHYIAR